MEIAKLAPLIEVFESEVYGSESPPTREIDFRGYAERGFTPSGAYRDVSSRMSVVSAQTMQLGYLKDRVRQATNALGQAGYFARFANLFTGSLDNKRKASERLKSNLTFLENYLDVGKRSAETDYIEAEEMVTKLIRRKIDEVSAIYREVRCLETALEKEIETAYGPKKLRKIRERGEYSSNIILNEAKRYDVKSAETFAGELDNLLALRRSETIQKERDKLAHRIKRYKTLKTTLDAIVKRASRHAESLIPEKEIQQAQVTDVGKYVERGMMFIHGVLISPNSGLNNNTQTNYREYRWPELIENVIKKRPHISASRSWKKFQTINLWSPVGLVITGGFLTYTEESEGATGATVAQPSGERTPFLDIRQLDVDSPRGDIPYENEVAIKNPVVGGIYMDREGLTDNGLKKVVALAEKHCLPIYEFGGPV